MSERPRAARRPRVLAYLATAVALALSMAPTAVAGPPAPAGLEVVGGEESWHPGRDFRLIWSKSSGLSDPAPARVRYRLRDPLGAPVGEGQLAWPASEINPLRVPPAPGAYTAEVWFEDNVLGSGPVASVKLRFDDARPGTVQPLAEGGWLGHNSFPLPVQLGHPGAPLPLAGIRGYAVSVDHAAAGDPCARPDRCTAAEIDLGGGIGDDSFAIQGLPEGVSYVHAVAVSGSGMRSATVGSATLRVDETLPTTELEGAPADWVDHPVTLRATAADSGSGMQPGGSGAVPFTAIRIDGGTPVAAAGDAVSARIADEGTHSVAYYARDLAGNVGDGASSNGKPDPPPAVAEVRIDRTPPRIAFAAQQDPREPELIRARVADSLSGVDPASGWIGVRRAGSGDRFQQLPASPAPDGELRARWDSDAFPAGDYEFEAAVGDRAGNVATTERRADGGPMLLGNPLKTPTRLTASFVGGGLSRRAPYGRGVLLHGRLSTARGEALAGAAVRIVEQSTPGATPGELTVWTGRDGRFAARLAPGPSRSASAYFAGTGTLTRAASRPLRLAVRSGVRLRASARAARVGGQPLVFSGKVAASAGTIPAEGKTVELQFRLPGLPWKEFRTIRTDRAGRFRYAYRFSDDDSRGVTFQFRAYAPAQDDWPYEPGGSRPVIVRGI